MSDSSNALLNKVRGLLALAEDPAATPQEAEAFSAKAEQLIAKYAIDTALLEAKEHKGKPTLKVYPLEKQYSLPKAVLLNVIAKAYGCQGVRDLRSKSFHVIGFESDLEMVDLLYTSLLLQGLHAVSRQYQSDRPFRTSFWYAFANRVGVRLEETKAKTLREEAEAHGTGTALVLASRSAEVDQAFNDAFTRTRTQKVGSVTSRAGANAGRAAADRANLNQRGVGGARTALR